MSERTAFAVVNKRGKVVEYTSRIPYQYGQVFYKGEIYQLKNSLPGMKAKRIIMLGTGYSVSNKKVIMKSPRKSKLIESRARVSQKQRERMAQTRLEQSERTSTSWGKIKQARSKTASKQKQKGKEVYKKEKEWTWEEIREEAWTLKEIKEAQKVKIKESEKELNGK